ncbi:MAG: hypothetical protein PHV34_23595 [Verrucomicrobiae bacterium]|nr:hypothetical protein [Verrucomicrobiae bacterium]
MKKISVLLRQAAPVAAFILSTFSAFSADADAKSASQPAIIFTRTLDDPGQWKITCHENEKPASIPEGAALSKAAKEDQPCLQLDYRFNSPKHDAVMLTTDVNIASGKRVGLTAYGDGSGHELFAVFEDASGEKHYLPLQVVNWKGWKTFYVPFKKLLDAPIRGSVSATHWGGDGSQYLKFPIRRLTIGLNDKPDSFQGSGQLWLKEILIDDKGE